MLAHDEEVRAESDQAPYHGKDREQRVPVQHGTGRALAVERKRYAAGVRVRAHTHTLPFKTKTNARAERCTVRAVQEHKRKCENGHIAQKEQ
jgi:hypothetical protein